MSSAYELTQLPTEGKKSSRQRELRPHLHSSPVVMQAEGLAKSFIKGKVLIPVLRGVDFEVREGEFQAIVGSSGSGKSTLLHLLATLDQPDDGKIFFEGNRIDNLPPASRDILRNRYIGIVFQFYHLLPELNALENVLMPLMIRQGFTKYMLSRRRNRRRAQELLEMVGLAHRLKHRPSELSGGEMQRVAIARSLIAEPRLLLADEPTGNLDRQSGGEIMEILRNLNREHQMTIMMVTHEESIAEQADRTIRLVEGRVQ